MLCCCSTSRSAPRSSCSPIRPAAISPARSSKTLLRVAGAVIAPNTIPSQPAAPGVAVDGFPAAGAGQKIIASIGSASTALGGALRGGRVTLVSARSLFSPSEGIADDRGEKRLVCRASIFARSGATSGPRLWRDPWRGSAFWFAQSRRCVQSRPTFTAHARHPIRPGPVSPRICLEIRAELNEVAFSAMSDPA